MTEPLGQGERPAVYTWEPHSNSGKPLFVLNEKGVEFDYRYISLPDFEQQAPEYVAINPDGTVPALVHRGRVLAESTPMCEYIDKAFEGPSLTPDDPQARYRMRNRCRRTDKAAESLSVIGWHLFLGPMVRSKPPQEMARLIARIPTNERRVSWETASKATFSESQLANARARVGDYVKELEADLSHGTWLVGDEFSLADVVTFANFYALPAGYPEFATETYAPHVLAWLRRIYSRPATAKTFGMARSIARRAFDVAKGLGCPMRSQVSVLDLHGSGDPATLKLAICLEELGLPYSFHPLDLSALAHWAPAHRKRAPQGEVPVLIADELVMTDAAIALLYLAESNPSPKLLPSNLVDRYEVQALDDVLDAALLTSVNLLGWHGQTDAADRAAYIAALGRVPGRQAPAGWSAVWNDAEFDRLRRAAEKISAGLAKLEAILGARQWLVATSFSIADISAFALLEGLSATPSFIDGGALPRVAAWLERMRHRPAVRSALAAAGRTGGAPTYAPPQ